MGVLTLGRRYVLGRFAHANKSVRKDWCSTRTGTIAATHIFYTTFTLKA